MIENNGFLFLYLWDFYLIDSIKVIIEDIKIIVYKKDLINVL